MTVISSIILPETDSAAYTQLILLIAVTAIASIIFRKSREVLTLIAGMAILTFAFMGLRAIH